MSLGGLRWSISAISTNDQSIILQYAKSSLRTLGYVCRGVSYGQKAGMCNVHIKASPANDFSLRTSASKNQPVVHPGILDITISRSVEFKTNI